MKNEEESCLICLKSIAVQNQVLGIWSLCNTYILHLYLVRYSLDKLFVYNLAFAYTIDKNFQNRLFEGSRYKISLLSNTLL